ncbi:hypothetical protein BSL78_11112 [Apostichopus japonicus]|uniref:NACHT domain-containing protein n=1 Tax=Stichopus japonicus TaxID=307972 RepID=A0A2G8KVR7_STIJA|nr:hypothetical protein BSL78_11112 [Apostichopus japonicus]
MSACNLSSAKDSLIVFFSGKKNDLIKYAKTAYRKQYETAKPFPSMNKCKLTDICSGRYLLLAQEGDFMQKPDVLESLDSYNDILSSPKTKSNRKIIEADPGFGKSTLASQFVYDWCTENPESPLKDVEILIFLQLRQLEGVKSIYTAIKHSIVPEDEDIDDSCIKEILKVYKKSVVMLFDSYDETLNLPPNLHPETKRIRLTGFGVAERRNYVLKAVADDVQFGRSDRRAASEKPLLKRSLSGPSFSTMVAHIAHERPEIEIFSTVTRFFTYVIACVHNHMKIKKDANTEVPAFERN